MRVRAQARQKRFLRAALWRVERARFSLVVLPLFITLMLIQADCR